MLSLIILGIEKIDIQYDKLEISEELRDRFFAEFQFDRLSKKCTVNILLKKALAAYFGRSVYETDRKMTYRKWIMNENFLILQNKLLDQLRV